MSLLLDALKKAALEKQRRAQDLPHGTAEQTNKIQEIVQVSVAHRLPSWVERKKGRVELEAAAQSDWPAHQQTAQLASNETSEHTAFGVQGPASTSEQEAVELEPALADLEDTHGTEQCEFIDLSDLDFASLVGFQSPQADEAPAPIQEAAPLELLVPAATAEAPQLPVGGEPSLPATDAGVASEPALPIPAQDEAEPQASEQSSAEALPAGGKYSHQAAKQALNELLNNSKLAAKRSRHRLISLYGLLVLTAASLVGLYYFLLQPTATLVAPMGSFEPSSTQPAQPQVDAASTLQVTQPAPESSQTAPEDLVPAHEEQQSAKPQPVAPQPVDSQVAMPDAVAVTQTEDSGAYSGETLTPVDVPIRTGVTEVLTYHPAQVDELAAAIERGYTAYEAGDFATAAAAYQAALALDPFQRDALLGAASVALQQGQPSQALNYFQQRLARAPKDDFALAGLLAISAQANADPQLDAQLSRLIAAYPQAAHLHYLQGTLYAQRQQWGAAQLALLAAWQWDNRNPDIACNLAIAFDHLQQPQEAVQFYRQALILANGQAVGFNPADIHTRLKDLEGVEQQERRKR